jgi:hypothetical protein
MSTSLPSVKDTYFQHKVLTRIHDKPIYEALQTLATKIKANAALVPFTLGGGLILSVNQYATLANTIPLQLEAAKDVWCELKLSFDLCQATEKALIAQIVESIDPIYLQALLNCTTGQYSTDVCAVLLHLFNTPGKITPTRLKLKKCQH